MILTKFKSRIIELRRLQLDTHTYTHTNQQENGRYQQESLGSEQLFYVLTTDYSLICNQGTPRLPKAFEFTFVEMHMWQKNNVTRFLTHGMIT